MPSSPRTPFDLPSATLLEHLSRPEIPHPANLHLPLAIQAADFLSLLPSLTPIPSLLSRPLLRTGHPSLDAQLSGGIPLTAQIFEISGQAGTGKTQLALQLAVMTALPAEYGGLGSGCIMLFTEGPPPVRRLGHIAQGVCGRVGMKDGMEQVLKCIVVERVCTAEDLEHLVEYRLPYLLREIGGKVVIVDSIAAVYRLEFEHAVERSGHLGRIAAGLKRAVGGCEGGGVCVCVNQVSQMVNGGGEMAPSLGRAWGACVEVRLFMEKEEGGGRLVKVLSGCYVEGGGNGVPFNIGAGGIEEEGGGE